MEVGASNDLVVTPGGDDPTTPPPGVALGIAPDEAPDPAARKRPGAVRGTPVILGGSEWLLADFVPALGRVWDDLYDSNVLEGRYEAADVQRAAVRILWANYDLSADEAVGLVLGADPGSLVGAVEAALFGEARPHRTYSDWAISSLLANGLDPKRVPPESLRDVLDQLVISGRAVAPEEFVTTILYAKERREILSEME